MSEEQEIQEIMSFVPTEYQNKFNKTPNQKKIKKRLEELGHRHVFVWWEPIEAGLIMCGCGGGYFAVSDREDLLPLGLSCREALDFLRENDDE